MLVGILKEGLENPGKKASMSGGWAFTSEEIKQKPILQMFTETVWPWKHIKMGTMKWDLLLQTVIEMVQWRAMMLMGNVVWGSSAIFEDMLMDVKIVKEDLDNVDNDMEQMRDLTKDHEELLDVIKQVSMLKIAAKDPYSQMIAQEVYNAKAKAKKALQEGMDMKVDFMPVAVLDQAATPITLEELAENVHHANSAHLGYGHIEVIGKGAMKQLEFGKWNEHKENPTMMAKLMKSLQD
ncbi:hypothetical protein EW146_g443 [Bondarzewia mesenterica]|uniref:Uncharacterized protein n=1 Tax=Bondarzewia mesenterica TaxID=1095465 RepID=A0A4S4M6X6_9AGAM|nr:hypothetical protein EW146_g443 [Bondarzewia mesenterica]